MTSPTVDLNRTSVASQDSTIHWTDMGQTPILASQTTFQSVREQTEMDCAVKVQCATNCTFNLNIYRS